MLICTEKLLKMYILIYYQIIIFSYFGNIFPNRLKAAILQYNCQCMENISFKIHGN